MQQLPGNYETVKAKGVKAIAISAGEDEKGYKKSQRIFFGSTH
ncbi:hypothetical protein [Chryseobacterium sp. FH2]|nr:hypothetical protein [Chryseobacterium sp. FH2]